MKKTEGQKSRDTVPLTFIFYQHIASSCLGTFIGVISHATIRRFHVSKNIPYFVWIFKIFFSIYCNTARGLIRYG
jgi:hypothetical protein